MPFGYPGKEELVAPLLYIGPQLLGGLAPGETLRCWLNGNDRRYTSEKTPKSEIHWPWLPAGVRT